MKIILWKGAKLALYFIIFLIVFILLYLFFAWLLSNATTSPKVLNCKKNKLIYATTNGVHIDIVLHRSLLDSQMLAALAPKEKEEYIAIGWGDKGFYLETPSWAELKVSTAVNAAFLLSETVMHVTHYQRLNSKWLEIPLCDSQADAIKNFINDSFRKNEKGAFIKLEGAGYGNHDFFYKAVGSYTCFYTCNVWVNQALKAAEVKTAIWSPFDNGIIKHL